MRAGDIYKIVGNGDRVHTVRHHYPEGLLVEIKDSEVDNVNTVKCVNAEPFKLEFDLIDKTPQAKKGEIFQYVDVKHLEPVREEGLA